MDGVNSKQRSHVEDRRNHGNNFARIPEDVPQILRGTKRLKVFYTSVTYYTTIQNCIVPIGTKYIFIIRSTSLIILSIILKTLSCACDY